MSSKDYLPYTYHIFHRPTQKNYYGVRYALGCHPSDLWESYFTSSKKIKQLISEYGKDTFDVKIRKTFKTPKQAVQWENRVLRKLKVLNNEKWINMNVGGRIESTQEINNLISLKLKGKPKSLEHRKKIAIARTGTKRLESTKQKIREARAKQVFSKESYLKRAETRKDYKHSEDTKKKISEGLKKSWEAKHRNN